MKIDVLIVGTLSVNCVILGSESGKAVLFDPGGDCGRIISFLDDKGLTPVKIINTHTHFDHVGAVHDLMDRYPGLTFMIHKDDSELLLDASKHAMYFGLPTIKVPRVDKYIKDGDVIEFEGVEIISIHTPGHTPGGMCYHIPELNSLISGDTLFDSGIGRTDLDGGDYATLAESIRKRLYVLGEETKVYPGHGRGTSIGKEKYSNPHVRIDI